jgi:hypothetical protein
MAKGGTHLAVLARRGNGAHAVALIEAKAEYRRWGEHGWRCLNAVA